MNALISAVLFTAICSNLAGTQDINVMSFNMNGSEANVDAVAEMIVKEAPAVIGIVECPSEGEALKAKLPAYATAGKGSNQVFYLKDALKCGKVVALGKKTVKLSFTILDSGREFDVFSAVIGKADGVEPAQKILDATVAGKPSIVIGTINAAPTGTFTKDPNNPNFLLWEKYVDGRYASISTDDTPSVHKEGKGKGSKMDFIYYSPEFAGMHFRVMSEPYAGVQYISDHYAVRDIIRFKK